MVKAAQARKDEQAEGCDEGDGAIILIDLIAIILYYITTYRNTYNDYNNDLI